LLIAKLIRNIPSIVFFSSTPCKYVHQSIPFNSGYKKLVEFQQNYIEDDPSQN
jgi:hypothetical protein